MKWNKFRLKTTTEAEDIVSSMLMDLGVQGIEIEDKIPLSEKDKSQMFVDILPEGPAHDVVVKISFYLEPDQDYVVISFRRLESMTASHISVSIWKKMKIKKVFWKL